MKDHIQDAQLSCWESFSQVKWNPQPTVQQQKQILIGAGIVFIIFAGLIGIFNASVYEVKVENYEKQCKSSSCTINFQIEEDFKGPVYLFYELDNFYQNHRRYIKSKSSSQLVGTKITLAEAETACSPVVKNSDLSVKVSITGKPLKQDAVAMPCGLIARSYFTDSFKIYRLFKGAKAGHTISSKGIAWPRDVGDKFRIDPAQKDNYWINVEDERFIVWMRTSGLPNFRKLWGIIDDKLVKGSYQFVINNVYDVSGFQGHKSLILSSNGPLGGKNNFLAYAFFVIGIALLLIALFFHMKQQSSNHRFGNVDYPE